MNKPHTLADGTDGERRVAERATASWSAPTCRAFGLGDLSSGEGASSARVLAVARDSARDGDKSPAKSGDKSPQSKTSRRFGHGLCDATLSLSVSYLSSVV